MTSRNSRILIIEDDPGVAWALYSALNNTYRVDTAKSGSSGLRKADNKQFDAVILDLNLPDISGLQVCKQLRLNGLAAPILILTGESAVATKVKLFDSGANDYLTKPFSLDELKARVRAVLRPSTPPRPTGTLVAGELSLDTEGHYALRHGQRIVLRRKEFAILECLMHHAGTLVSRSLLMAHAWNGQGDGWTNTIDVHIKYLRDKIDRPFAYPLIKTVHGLGYKLDTTKPAGGQ